MPENLKGVCRLCLSKEGFMVPIFRKDTKSETSFRNKILTCASIEVFADDELPSEICHQCAHQVEKSFQFRSICENSDAALRSQLNQIDNEALQQDTSVHSLDLEQSELEWSDKRNNLGHGKNDDIMCFPERVCDSDQNENGLFSCFACSLGFPAYDLLIEHLRKNHPDVTLFPCKTCKLHFLDINEFRIHLNVRHALNCSKCDHVFKYQKNLDLHLKSHSVEIYSCQHCKKVFDKQYELKQHELSHLVKMCMFCCKIFGTKEEYANHVETCNKTYSCKFCNQKFQFQKDLIEHVNSYHENTTIQKCKNCNKMFAKWEDFQQHPCVISLEKPLQCKYCQQMFTDSAQLESHITSDHSDESLVCKFCTKSFTLKSALRRHEKSHSGLKPYQCKYCPRKFKDNSTCIVHIRTHTGEHPFQCQECHKDFKQLANLKMHTYRHHKISNKMTEEKTEILREAEQIYGQLYTTSIIDGYSPDGTKSFQQIDSDITTTFGDSAGVLLTEHH